MNRRDFLGTSTFTLAATAIGRTWLEASWLQQTPPATKFQDIRGGVGFFTGQGGTIGWYVSRDAVVIVDSQFPATAETCMEGIEQKTRHAFDLLINTHHHGDHTAGNKTFRSVVKSILAHQNSATWQKKAAVDAKTEADQAYPDVTIADVWTKKMGGETITAKYYGAGHTSGDLVVSFETANVVHMGDLMFNRLHPFIDRPAGASIANWIKTLDTVPGQHSSDTAYIFGHGQNSAVTGGRAELARFRDYLTAVLDFTSKQVRAGRSKEEIAKTASLPSFDDFAAPNARINLASVLATAYDEMTSK